MTDPTTLSLADLAAAVVLLGARRGAGDSRVLVNSAEGRVTVADAVDYDDIDLLLAAANRLPGVVEDLDAALELITGLNRRLDEQPPTVDQLYRAESGALLARAAEGVAVRERDAAIRRADVIAEAARSVLALAEPLIAKHSGPYPASVVADLRAVLEQPGLVDSLYAAEVLADGCGRTARLEQERDAAIARVAAAEGKLRETTYAALAAREQGEADTVARIVAWLDDPEGEPISHEMLRGYGLQDYSQRVETCRDMFAEMIKAGAWRGKEQA